MNKEHNWWPGTNKINNHVDEDFLQNDDNNLPTGTDGFHKNELDFDMVEGNSRVKPDKSTTRREDIPKLFLDDLLEDESDSRRRKAAVHIQRWFRGWKARKELSGQNAVKQLLSQKKIEKEKQVLSEQTEVHVYVCSIK